MTKRHLLGLTTVVLILFVIWLFGYDFNHRGFVAGMSFLTSIIMTLLVYFIPESSLDEKFFKDKE